MVKRTKRKRPSLSSDERRKLQHKRRHIREIRSVFRHCGFIRVRDASNREFRFRGTTTDFDDLYVFENVLVLAEYTTSQESNISSHLKNKKVPYDKINTHPQEFIRFLDDNVPTFFEIRGATYRPEHYKIIILYCSLNLVKRSLKDEVPGVSYFDYHTVQYFKSVTGIVKSSARYELFDFLGLNYSEIGNNIISPGGSSVTPYDGSILPEAHSHFGHGFKVVSFYVDPEALLRRCYVLRKDRWEEKGALYQRMITRSKIESVRKYLMEQKRVFINNIIVTLPSSTRLLDASGNTRDARSLVKTAPVRIQLPSDYNSIGLIDGQHRVFSYYEGGANEDEIGKLRRQQNLLVTGIIYPPNVDPQERIKFEATLFLEINSNQTNARSDLKQAIGLILKPFSPDSIAKEVVNLLNEEGPLSGHFERYFFDKGKLKTTSVVSYGVKPLVKPYASDSLFKLWRNKKKRQIAEEKDSQLLTEYIKYCVGEINKFISAIKASVPKERWTADSRVKSRLLTTTNVNGFVSCLRNVVKHEKIRTFEYYHERMTDIAKFPFLKYRSSQYNRLGDELYEKYFRK